MSPNPFRFPLSFSLLVGVEVWDHSDTLDPAVLRVAAKLIVCDAAVHVAAPEWLDKHTHECFSAAVDLVLNEGVVL
jgi:hypothetical protein